MYFAEDSDFVAKGSGSDDDLEYDSNVSKDENEGDDSGGEESTERAKKRKKEQSKSRPAKKRKQVSIVYLLL